MIEFLKNWILNIVILVVLIVILEMLIPTGKIKKVVNLVSGFVLIIAIVNPFLAFTDREINLADFQISGSNFLDKREIEQNSKILEERQIEQIADIYRKKILSQIEEAVEKTDGISNAEADIIINEDYNSKDFGTVKRIYVYIGIEDDSEKEDSINIDKVKINSIGKNNTDETDEKINNTLIKKVKDKIERLFEIDRQNIVISLIEE